MKTVYTCFSTDVIHAGHLNIIKEDLVFYKIDEKNKLVTIYAVVEQRQDYMKIIRGL